MPYRVRITGAAPANDLCANAAVVTTSTVSLSVDNSTATADIDPGTCNTGAVGNFGVWYTFTPLADGTVIFDETSGQDVASGLWVIAGPVTGCGDFTGTNGLCLSAESWATKFLANLTYYVQIGNTAASAPSAPITANITWLSSAPANDACTGAEVVPAGSTWPLAFAADNRFASDDAIDTCSTTALTNAPHSVWYRYTPSTSGSFAIDETSAQNVAIAAWDVATAPVPGTDCPTFTGASALSCTVNESLVIPVTAGHTYYILIHSELPNPQAPLVALAGSFTQIAAPANDLCPGAVVATAPTNLTAFGIDARGATPDVGLACNTAGFTGATTAGTWFRIEIPAGGDDYTVTLAESTASDAIWGVFTGSCAGLTPYACYTADTANTFPAVAGQTYYALLGLQGSAQPTLNPTYTVTISFAVATSACCNSTLNTCVVRSTVNCAAESPSGSWRGPISVTCSTTTNAANACQPAPANDLCSGAIALVPGAPVYTTAFPAAATHDADSSCNTTGSPAVATRMGVWYSYTTGADGGTLRLNESLGNDVIIQQYSGTCGSLAPVFCTDPELNVDFFIPPSTTHYFLMGLFSNTAVPTVAYSLTAVSFTASTGGCCTGTACAIGTQSTCAGLWLGANASCVGAVTYTVPTAGNCASAFEDIVATGTSVVIDSPTTPSLDDGSGPATIPFNFPFFANVYNTLRIGTNGLILFNPTTITDANNRNITPVTLPSTAAPNDAIYALWDDLDARPANAPNATIKYELRGTAGVDLRFIIQWDQLIHFAQPDSNTFQVVLFENGNIEIRYGLVHAWSATTWDFQIGIENGAGTSAYTVPGAAIGSGNTCIRFTRVAAVDPCVVAGACCNAGMCALVTGAANCPGAPSNFQGGGSTCSPNPCSTSGACCSAATGACAISTSAQAGCPAGSAYQNDGTVCLPNPCPQPPSVCCRGSTCNTATTQANCLAAGAAGAVFIQPAAACNSVGVSTTPCCYADYNKAGGTTVADIFAFLGDWFAGSRNAVVGGNGDPAGPAPTVGHIFQFLTAWFAGGC